MVCSRNQGPIADSGTAFYFSLNWRFLSSGQKPAYFYRSSLGFARRILLGIIPVVSTTPAVQVIVMALVLLFLGSSGVHTAVACSHTATETQTLKYGQGGRKPGRKPKEND